MWDLLRLGRRTRRLIVGHLRLVPLIVLLGVIAAALEGLGIGLVMPLLDTMTGRAAASGGFAGLFRRFGAGLPAETRVLLLGGLIVGLVLLKNLVAGAAAILTGWVYGRTGEAIRAGLARRLTEFGFSFFSEQRPGLLLNVLSTESWRTADAIGTALIVLTNASAAVILFVFLCLLSWRLTLAVAVGLCLIQLVQALASRPLRRMSRGLTERNGELASQMLHLVEAARLIRIFGQASAELARFAGVSHTVRQTLFRLERRKALVPPAMEALYAILFVTIVVGAYQTGQSFSLIAAFVVLLYRMQPNVRNLQAASAQLHALAGSLAAVEQLLDPDGKPQQPSGPLQPPERLRQAISFREVSFGYAAGARRSPVLRAVSCEFRAGRSTALVGRSGAGKSTIVNLLCRLNEPDSGSIWIDDLRLADLDTAAWRSRLAVASQDLELVEGTIAENIAYGTPEASRADIVGAAKLADAHDFIERLPGGYEAVVGHRGAQLSAGQRQRVALARALLRDPALLILDEATNALDGISERAIIDTLVSRAGRATTIIISHHRKTLACCDDIVVLDGGRVQASIPRLELADGEIEDLYREGASVRAGPSAG